MTIRESKQLLLRDFESIACPLTLRKSILPTTVILGDPRLPDKIKKEGKFNAEDIETVQELKKTLRLLKNFRFHYLDNHETLFQQLLDAPPCFVFNLCDEGFNNQATQELHVPALLEMLEIPYTGAGPSCLAICYNKSATRLIAHSLGIPVPLETYFSPTITTKPTPPIYPAIIKPNYGDGSYGISHFGVVQNEAELARYLAENPLQGPLLIQEFLSGREFSVAVLGNPGKFEVLPILEIDYSSLPSHLPKLLSYESKWIPGSPYWDLIKFKEAQIPKALRNQLHDYATLLFEHLECRDYARFDFRSDASGTIKILEVNPNPGFNWLTVEDYADDKLLGKILTAARNRYGL